MSSFFQAHKDLWIIQQNIIFNPISLKPKEPLFLLLTSRKHVHEVAKTTEDQEDPCSHHSNYESCQTSTGGLQSLGNHVSLLLLKPLKDWGTLQGKSDSYRVLFPALASDPILENEKFLSPKAVWQNTHSLIEENGHQETVRTLLNSDSCRNSHCGAHSTSLTRGKAKHSGTTQDRTASL